MDQNSNQEALHGRAVSIPKFADYLVQGAHGLGVYGFRILGWCCDVFALETWEFGLGDGWGEDCWARGSGFWLDDQLT